MSSYDDYLRDIEHWFHFMGAPGPLKYSRGINLLYDHSHGGLRYTLSQLPVTGKIRQFGDQVRYWQDYYNNTGKDPNYSTSYGSRGIPFVNDFINTAVKPARMVKSLDKLFGAEVELDIAKERHMAWEASQGAARSWQQYERMKRDRMDKYGR